MYEPQLDELTDRICVLLQEATQNFEPQDCDDEPEIAEQARRVAAHILGAAQAKGHNGCPLYSQ